jgi:hypothetical protein
MLTSRLITYLICCFPVRQCNFPQKRLPSGKLDYFVVEAFCKGAIEEVLRNKIASRNLALYMAKMNTVDFSILKFVLFYAIIVLLLKMNKST